MFSLPCQGAHGFSPPCRSDPQRLVRYFAWTIKLSVICTDTQVPATVCCASWKSRGSGRKKPSPGMGAAAEGLVFSFASSVVTVLFTDSGKQKQHLRQAAFLGQLPPGDGEPAWAPAWRALLHQGSLFP